MDGEIGEVQSFRAKVVAQETYSLSIGGKVFPNFRVKERWEGLTCMEDDQKRRVIVYGFPSSVGGLFSRFSSVDGQEFDVLLAAPEIIAEIAK